MPLTSEPHGISRDRRKLTQTSMVIKETDSDEWVTEYD